MFEQQDSLNSSHSEATGRMWAPANLPAHDRSMQPVALPCQQRRRQQTTGIAQPRLTKAVLDQHEKAALTSLLLMQQQSSPMKVRFYLSSMALCLLHTGSVCKGCRSLALASYPVNPL